MACSNLTGGFTLDCNDSNGGIDKIFIANGPVDSITQSSGTITAITVAGSALTFSVLKFLVRRVHLQKLLMFHKRMVQYFTTKL